MKYINKGNDKNKKTFEVRSGDWICSRCSNLNFNSKNKNKQFFQDSLDSY